jgi:hypothetical protein
LIVNKLFIDNKIILIENSIKIIDNYLLSIKLVINNQEKVKYCYFKIKSKLRVFY